MRRFTWLGGLVAIAWIAFSVRAGALAVDASPSPIPVNATITLSVSSGLPGTPFTITGNGFPASEFVALYIDQPVPYLGFPIRADAQGAFRQDTKWPDTSYDSSKRVNPTAPGPHSICGDTGYQGSTQPLAAKACAQFQVQGRASPSPTPGVVNTGASLPQVLVALAILIALVVGTVLWMRRSP
jgi:hypothetical protein